MNKGIINMTVPPNWSSISANSIKIPRGLFLFVIELDNLFLNFMWKLKANDKQETGEGALSVKTCIKIVEWNKS